MFRDAFQGRTARLFAESSAGDLMFFDEFRADGQQILDEAAHLFIILERALGIEQA